MMTRNFVFQTENNLDVFSHFIILYYLTWYVIRVKWVKVYQQYNNQGGEADIEIDQWTEV